MQDVFGYVLFGTVIVGTLVALATMFLSGKAYDQIGEGGFFKDAEGARAPSGSAVDVAERDAEIRQMLAARNARREAKGGAVVDIEAELARLTAPSIDAQLREEIRQHVMARNARRMRKGQEPLDVEAEVERSVRELGGG
ncbi:MAG: hypothetical protein QOE86_401 [Solirubrobacteraceae bacterium]|nr:hypothetical protein [Solirubrobacteraceae bacterium]